MDETMSETVRTKPFAPFEWLLSGRYLRARRKEGFISVIAGFSFLGIMLGVATLIIVMAVMNGFRKELLDKIREKGVEIVFITLHVGLGTFRPVSVDTIENHEMHSEYYSVSEEAAATIRKTKESGGRVIAVGTTSTRTLETIASEHGGDVVAAGGWTSIFIYPGYEYKAIDGLITNFHLPKSTLIMLVSAFSSREIILNAYRHAVDERYRFFSFGDAMFLKPPKKGRNE